jgi:hypothetical protein
MHFLLILNQGKPQVQSQAKVLLEIANELNIWQVI